MVYSSILGGRLVGIGLEKLSLYHATLNILSPPYRNIFTSAQRDILVGAEQVARERMDRARMELESMYQLVSSNNRVHCVASYDGAYQLRSRKSAVALVDTVSLLLFRWTPVKFYLMRWLVTVVLVVMGSS